MAIAGRDMPVERGALIALAPGVEHDCRRLGDADGWSVIFLADSAAGDGSSQSAFGHAIPADRPFDVFRLPVLHMTSPIALTEPTFTSAVHCVQVMHDELRHRRAGYDIVVRSALQMLLVLAGREIADLRHRDTNAPDRAAQRFLAAVFADIEASYAAGASLREAARRLGIQPGHLTTKLRALSGRTYGAWVIERRMIEARRLLSATHESLDAIAGRVGYGDAESFVRRFRAQHGVSPGAWRRSAQSRSITA